ncbi:hypothetical protein [Parasphingorhabdus sp.]|uniref:hypothetical protein n=1 Tax=Parasphingorhabdus sp. TaxID=2709688 RepID=UPI003D2C9995
MKDPKNDAACSKLFYRDIFKRCPEQKRGQKCLSIFIFGHQSIIVLISSGELKCQRLLIFFLRDSTVSINVSQGEQDLFDRAIFPGLPAPTTLANCPNARRIADGGKGGDAYGLEMIMCLWENQQI